jgi:hypothetical protein
MSEPDMEADENGAGMGHTGGCGVSETRLWRCGAAEPAGEADPGAFPGRMTVAPPLEVSTQAKRVFPFAPLAGYPDRGGGLLPRGSSPWRGALGSRPLRKREPYRLVPLSHHSSWELAPAGRFQASPPLEFSGETPSVRSVWVAVRTRSSAERVRRASFSIPVCGKRLGVRSTDRKRDGAEGSRGEGQPTQRGPARRGVSPLVREALCGQIGRDVVPLASDPAAAPAGQRRERSAPTARRTAHRCAGRAHAARRRSRSHRGQRWQSPSSCQRC